MKGGFRRVLTGAMGLALLTLACNFSGASSARPTSPAKGPTATTKPSQPAATTAAGATAAAPGLDLEERPQIWFGPQPEGGPISPADFFELFSPDAPWKQTAEGVHVLFLYGGWVDRASQDELRMIMDDARRRRMGLAYELAPLESTAQCDGATAEGFGATIVGRTASLQIQKAGGRLDYVHLEHPYDAVTFSGVPPECDYSAERAAQDIAIFAKEVRSVFPQARFGADETANHDPQAVAEWVEAYRSDVGEDLSFFSLDVDYDRPEWPHEARLIEDYIRGRGLEFGIFYRGDADDESDAEWVTKAEQRFVEFEVIAGGRPDRAIFQSWHYHPHQLLPETDPTTFTHLVSRYLRTRTTLTVVTQHTAGAPTLSGTLVDAQSRPLPNSEVSLRFTPLGGPGIVSDYVLSDKVPQGATQAVVGYRINHECGCSGDSELTMYELSYMEAGSGNLVSNWKFADGLTGWGFVGAATQQIVPSDLGAGNAFQVRAQAGQEAALDSFTFPVRAGADFTFTVKARVAPFSEGSGYFAVIFLGPNTEIRRFQIPLKPGTASIGKMVTDSSGAYALRVDSPHAWRAFYEAWYAGDDTFWPAYATATADP